MTVVERRLSDAMATPLVTAYRVGGLGLAILVLGALLMFAGGITGTGTAGISMLVAGFVVILIPCYFFYAREVRPLRAVERAVNENRELIDAIQDSAIAVTELAQELQALAFKHADDVARMIEIVKPIVSSIPFARGVTEHPALVSAGGTAQSIVKVTQQTRQVVDDVKAALVASDPSTLRPYIEKLRKARHQVSDILAQVS